jgi:(p)ppGpp synthase/HD superfamily hydrolase
MDKNELITNKALEFAREKHKGQMRKNNTPVEYITHPINVANLVKKYANNAENIDDLVSSAYLHDTLEDTNTTYEELICNFGNLISNLVKELTNNDVLKKEIGKTKYLSMKMKSMSEDALIIKLCDRLDNVSSLYDTNKAFIDKYLRETISILNYIINNRNLNTIHLNIINDINKEVNNIIKCCTVDNILANNMLILKRKEATQM